MKDYSVTTVSKKLSQTLILASGMCIMIVTIRSGCDETINVCRASIKRVHFLIESIHDTIRSSHTHAHIHNRDKNPLLSLSLCF